MENIKSPAVTALVQDIEEFGLSAAFVLYHISYWVCLHKYNHEKNGGHTRTFREGKYWMFQTQERIRERLNFYDIKTIQRAITKLIEGDVLLTGNFNIKGYDNTTWYTLKYIDDLQRFEFHFRKIWQKDPPQNVPDHPPKCPDQYNIQNKYKDCLSKDKQSGVSPQSINFEDYDNAVILKSLIDIWADIDGAMSLQLRKTKTFDATIKALQKALKKHDPEDMAVCMHAYGKIYNLKGSTLSRKTKMSLLQFLTIRDEHQRIYMHNLGIPDGMTWLEICGMEWEYLRGKFSKMRQDRFPEITKVIREQWKRSIFNRGDLTENDENNFRFAAIRLEQYFYDRIYDRDLNFHHGEDDNPVKFAYVFMKALFETCKDSKIPVLTSWLITDKMFDRVETYLEMKGHTKRG